MQEEKEKCRRRRRRRRRRDAGEGGEMKEECKAVQSTFIRDVMSASQTWGELIGYVKSKPLGTGQIIRCLGDRDVWAKHHFANVRFCQNCMHFGFYI